MTPVHIVGGFLGAGKTTTLIELLRGGSGERAAVIVNDFGTARVDDAVLADETVARIAEIAGACVCCTAPTGLLHELRRILDEVRPDRVFIEPTGLGRPADIVDTLRRGPLRDRVAVGPVIVVIDPAAVFDGRFDALIDEQADAADVIVVNHTDRATPAALAATDALLARLWPGPARVVRTAHGRVSRDVLDALRAGAASDGVGPDPRPAGRRPLPDVWGAAPPRADIASDVAPAVPPGVGSVVDGAPASTAGFTVASRVWPIDVVFAHDRLRTALAGLAPSIVRAKGLFRTDEGVVLLERAGGAVHARAAQHRGDSRVDVIAVGDGADVAILALAACELTPTERAASGDAVEIVGLGAVRRFDAAALAALPDGVPDVGALIPGRVGAAARVDRLLARVGAGEGEAVVVAIDGLATPPVPLATLRSGLLVYANGGSPLSAKDGGPIRLLIPGEAAGPCANVKGVARIVLRSAL